MTKLRSNVLREYAGAEDGTHLTEILNRNQRKEKGRRLVRILELIAELLRLNKRLQATPRSRSSPLIIATVRLHMAVYKEFKNLRLHSRITPMMSSPGHISFHWAPCRQTDFDEGRLLITHLAEQGLLDRVRQCGKCRTWFYARFRHQQFCSTKCQTSHYKGSEEWKAHRREWMRNYRGLQRRGTLK